MKKIVNDILDVYNKEILSKELGEGTLKKRLLNGLERVLVGVEIPKKAVMKKPFIYSDESIDFKSIREISSKNISQRLKYALRTKGIATYRDLARVYLNEELSSSDYGKEGYAYFLSRMRYIGLKSRIALFTHLDKVGFDYSTAHAKILVAKTEIK
ncbi:hypothetical protein J4465_00400 [Candidatus Pacearchaeota archaeon]|nr:hypothetical protein [Candidatus Pacearchaeota archaeon]